MLSEAEKLQVALRKIGFKKGQRVEIVYPFNDPYRELLKGLQGTVIKVDDLGTVHTQWDSGIVLGATLEDVIKTV